MIFALLFESHRQTWKIIIIMIFSFNKFELIDLFTEIVAKRQIDDCFWIFFLNDLFYRVVCHVCWNVDDTIIRIFCTCRIDILFCFERWFSRERFSRIELLQNKCFQKHFENAFRRREFEKFRLFIERSFFFDVIRCSYSNSFRCVCTFIEKTNSNNLYYKLYDRIVWIYYNV